MRIKNRPLSPHLTVYKIQETSLFSILQRISGILIFLTYFCFCFGTLIFYLQFPTWVSFILVFYSYIYLYLTYSFIAFTTILIIYHTFKGIYLLLLDTYK